MLVLSEKELVGQKDAQTVQLGEKRSTRERQGARGSTRLEPGLQRGQESEGGPVCLGIEGAGLRAAPHFTLS